MDFNKISVFVSIVETGGLTAAGRKLNLPKSSVSRILKQLEAELGAQLIIRDPRHPRLTAAGRRLFETAAPALSAVEHTGTEIQDVQNGLHGPIRIAAQGYLGILLLPLLRTFTAAQHHVQVDLTVTGRILDPIRDEYDIVVCGGPLADSSAVGRPLTTPEWALYASPDYLARRGVPNTVADLQAHDWVQCLSAMASPRWALHGPQGEEHVTMTPSFHVDETMQLVAMAHAGTGIVLLPVPLVAHATAPAAALTRVLPEYRMNESSTAYVLFAGAGRAPQRVRTLVDEIVTYCRSREPSPVDGPSLNGRDHVHVPQSLVDEAPRVLLGNSSPARSLFAPGTPK